jgi:phospholipase C
MSKSLSMVWVIVLAAACHPASHGPGVADAGPPVSEDQARALRLACTFSAGALPAETLATAAPRGEQIPLDHILLVMQENRSFDELYSGLADAGVRTADPGASNPDADGGGVARYHEASYCVADTEHGWAGAHQEWDEGANDGFVLANAPDGARAMGYYDESDLGFDYALARAFAISDMHFSSVLGPTWPNRMYFFGATSWGLVSNDLPPVDDPQGHRYPNLFEALSAAGVSWKVYSEGAPSVAMLVAVYAEHQAQFLPLSAYFDDLDAGALPQVAWVEANYGSGAAQDDEHPPGDIQLGEQFVSRVVQALMGSAAWARSALLLTYDENGGLYDSVPPPSACPPDALPPRLAPGDPDAGFDRYGFRVPLIAISPFARPGYVSHAVSDHTSLVRFVEARFGLPALTHRDANADPLLDLFDFSHPQPAPALPEPQIDTAQLSQCEAQFPPTQ